MAIILDRPGFGAQLGTSLGGGLGKAFEALAGQKLEDMQRRSQQERQARGLRALFPGEQAEQLAEFDPLVLREILKQQLPQMQEAKLTSLVENILGGAEGEMENIVQPEQMGLIQALLVALGGGVGQGLGLAGSAGLGALRSLF